MNIDHDMHVHSPLSACYHDKEITIQEILEAYARLGVERIGFEDHLWDNAMPGASPWYKPQDMEHIKQIREMIPEDTLGIEIMFGCESEFWGKGKCGISKEAAEKLDFVLLPASHLHMKEYILPNPDMTDEEIGSFMVKLFMEALDENIATGIPHPFVPCTRPESVDRIVGSISDSSLKECFSRAAQEHVSIEITTSSFPSIFNGEEKEGHHDATYIRVLSIAKECSCRFHCASDSHDLEKIAGFKKLETVLKKLNITDKDIHPFAKNMK